jgi:hypothetical protein
MMKLRAIVQYVGLALAYPLFAVDQGGGQAQEKPIVNGEPKSGPDEKKGKDEIEAGRQYLSLGVQRARDFTKIDEGVLKSKTNIRQDLLMLFKQPQAVWETYGEGFKMVMDERKKDDKPTATLSVMRSKIGRLVNAAKKNHSLVMSKLGDPKLSFEAVIKAMPRRSGAGRPEVTPPLSVDGIDEETNVGTLLQIINGAAQRMVFLGQEKNATYALYMGTNVLEFVEIAQNDFQRITAEHSSKQGIITDPDKYLRALSLVKDEKPIAATEVQKAA